MWFVVALVVVFLLFVWFSVGSSADGQTGAAADAVTDSLGTPTDGHFPGFITANMWDESM